MENARVLSRIAIVKSLKRSMAFCLMPLVATLSGAPDAANENAASDDRYVPLEYPNVSGPAYSLFQYGPSELDIIEIDRRLSDIIRSKEVNETEALLYVSRDIGYPLQIVRLDPRNGRNVAVPSLLIVLAIEVQRGPPRLLLVEAKSENGLHVCRFNGTYRRGFVPFAELPLIWRGDTICRQPQPVSCGSWWLVIGGLILAIVAIVQLQRSRFTRTAKGCAIGVLFCVIGGCHAAASLEVEQRLVIRGEQIKDLGTIGENGEVLKPFSVPIEVRGDGYVSILNVKGDCSCLLFSEGIVGKQFYPGETIDLKGQVSTIGKTGEDLVIVQVEASDNTGHVETHRIGLRFVVAPRPLCDVRELSIIGYLTHERAIGIVDISLFRPDTSKPLEVLAFDGMDDDVVVRTIGKPTSSRPSGGNVVRDHCSVEIVVPKRAMHEREFVLVVHTNYPDELSIPVRVHWKHPVEVQPNRMFLASLQSQQTVNRKIVIRTSGECNPANLQVESTAESIRVSAIDWQADGVGTIALTIVAGAEIGRVEEMILIRELQSDVPPLELPIAWIGTR